MKKTATAAAPSPMFFSYQFDTFTQKYVKISGNEHPIFTGELYLNSPLKDSIRHNGANAKYVLAHRFGRIVSGLVALSKNTFVGNIGERDPLNETGKKCVFYVRYFRFEDGKHSLNIFLYPTKYPKNKRNFALSQLDVFNELVKPILEQKQIQTQ